MVLQKKIVKVIEAIASPKTLHNALVFFGGNWLRFAMKNKRITQKRGFWDDDIHPTRWRWVAPDMQRQKKLVNRFPPRSTSKLPSVQRANLDVEQMSLKKNPPQLPSFINIKN